MNRHVCALPAALAALLALAALPPPAAAQEGAGAPIGLDQAVKAALEKGPGVGAAQFNLEAALMAKKKSIGGFLPVLSAQLTALYYNEKPGISSGGSAFAIDPTKVPPPESAFDTWLLGTFAGMSDLFSGFESKQYDVTFTLKATQPLTPLYQVYFGYKLADLGVDVARVQLEKTRADLRYRVTEAYWSILKLEHALAAMDEAIASVKAHQETARQFYDAQLMTKNDLLQVAARLAEMESQRIALEGTLEIAREGLAALMGLEPGAPPPLQDPPQGEPSPPPPFAAAMKAAMEGRSDLKEMKLVAQQAKAAVKLAAGGFIPVVAVTGQYQHNEGSLMQMPELAVAGVLSWDFWDWGTTFFGYKEAKARAKAAEAGLSSLKAAAAVEVKEALVKMKVAALTLEKAEAGVAASQEQLRIEKERYAQNVNTSTDVLDAQARLTSALLSRENARADIHVALALLVKATGKEW